METTHDRNDAGPPATQKICIVGASGKLGQYMVRHALDRGYEVVGVCREASVGKLDAFKGRITVIPGATDDRDVIRRAAGELRLSRSFLPGVYGLAEYGSTIRRARLGCPSG